MLDEPTSGLDPLVQQTFYDVIREAKAEGRTIFMSSHILSEVEKTCDRVAIIRDGRLVRVDRVEALRDMAHHQVELRFAGAVPVGEFEALPGVSRRRRRGPRPPHARLGPDHPGRPRRRALRAGRLREPRAVARGDVPRRVRPAARRPRRHDDDRRSRPRGGSAASIAARAAIFGLGSVFGKTIRDSRRATIIVGAADRRPARRRRAGDRQPSSRRPSRAQEIGNLVDAVPPILQGLAGKPVNVETLGGYLQYKYGGFFPLVTGLWSILALSGDARRRERGAAASSSSLAAPISRRRIALEKVARPRRDARRSR